MSNTETPVGARVEVPAGHGILRFSGTTSFAPGKWMGIELDESKGKNDGSVQGVRYFNCKPSHGVFVRPSQVKILPTGNGAIRPTNSPAAIGNILARSSSFRSIPQSPRSSSPAKIPSSPLPSSRVRPSGAPSPTKRLSIVRPRNSFAPQTPPSPQLPSTPKRVETPNVDIVRPPAASDERRSTPEVLPPNMGSLRMPPTSSSISREPTRPSPEITVQNPRDEQEIQELRAKLRVLEAKRTDDTRVIEKLEAQLAEANSFVVLRPKLQAKLSALQQELISTRRQLSDAEQISTLNEGRILDAQEQLEMVMLDKEVAEERAEAFESELESLKEQLATMEVELQNYQGDGGLPGENGSTPEQSSLAYIQLEKHNERLKEALIKLRDLAHESETEQRHRIADLERELAGVDELHSQYESTLIKLTNADNQIDDLKIQLDDAMGAEEMLVQLTERNLLLGEKIEEMRITIEDLEALKELNDELEENHIETEKALQEDLDAKESQIREHTRKISELEDACQDYDNTINQFRELVIQLQTDLDTLRTQNQNAQNESATAASQASAVLSMNMKLQSTLSKSQARNIDWELHKIEAAESKELLAIVQPYLPELYVDTDTSATSCYMFFRRVGYKADLINYIVGQAHGLPESLNGPVSDVLVGICEMRSRISTLSVLCRRFSAVMRRCDVESFLNVGKIYPEIAPIERRIDLHIDLLRREEFREMECVSDIVKIQAQFEHLAETYFDGFDFDLGERELGYALSLDNDLDMFSASIGLTKTAIQTVLSDSDVSVDLEGCDPDSDLFLPLQRLLDQCKGAKFISRKLTKRLEDVIHESAALRAELLPQLQTLNHIVPDLVDFGIQLAQQVMPHIAEARNSKQSLQLSALLSFVQQTASSTVATNQKNSNVSWSVVSDTFTAAVQAVSALVPTIMDPVNVTKISATPPWVARVAEVKASLAINLEAERKVTQLNDEIQGLARAIKTKDQTIQESSVRIELMERRMETVKKQADAILDLESEMAKAKKQEKAYEEAIEQLQADLDSLEQDNAKLKASAISTEKPAPGVPVAETETFIAETNLEASHLLEQIESLRGALRYLRQENAYLKGQDLLREIQALPPLPSPGLRPPTPPLDPSVEESEESDEERQAPRTFLSLNSETKALYHDLLAFSSTPRVIDISAPKAKSPDETGRAWMPRKQKPAYQLLERKLEAERLGRRVRSLVERTSNLVTSI